jgi:hypothetical protein
MNAAMVLSGCERTGKKFLVFVAGILVLVKTRSQK